VDDGEIFSTQDDIDKVIKEFGKTLKVKNLCKLENFVGCRIIENK
jgi:hypothetical protein